MTALRELLAGVVDYAGLYPPAGLAMATAVENYSRYRDDTQSWMLGRFVVPATKLNALDNAVRNLSISRERPWHLSVVLASVDELELVEEQNRKAVDGGPALLADAVEIRANTGAEVDSLATRRSTGIAMYIEVPIAPDPASLLERVRAAGMFAKVRTGGVTSNSIPSAEDVLRFMQRCAEIAISFKATAGLHHPVRATYPLTYEAGCPQSMMFGFLNVLLSAALVRRGDMSGALELLGEQDPSSLEADSESVSWRGTRFPTSEISAARRFLQSFGSCSFEEPVNELMSLQLL